MGGEGHLWGVQVGAAGGLHQAGLGDPLVDVQVEVVVHEALAEAEAVEVMKMERQGEEQGVGALRRG